MKIKIFCILFAILIPINPARAWGDEGHRFITRKAFDLLVEDIPHLTQWAAYVEEHCTDADDRKSEDKTEGPKHYIDIDFYPEFRRGEMIYDLAELIATYNDSIVTRMGTLPWATLTAYRNLVQAFSDINRDRILIYSSDLAHYVGDGHQPMHTVLNYDGQMTNQKGLHARYEIHMLEKYLAELDRSFYPQAPVYLKEPLDFVFHYITTANVVSSIIYDADNQAFSETGTRDSDAYYKILWFRTEYITCLQANNAARDLASLIFSAWTEAGKPNLKNL